MESSEASSQDLLEGSTTSKTNASLHGAWLVAARSAWMLIALACLVLFFASIPAYFSVLHQVCSGEAATLNICNTNNQLSLATVQTLAQSHISLDDYATLVVIIDSISSLTFLLTGALIFWRKSNERFPLFVSLVLILFGALGPQQLNRSVLLINLYPTWQVALPVKLFQLSIYPALGLFFYLFPTGRLVPRWSWIFFFAWIVQVMFYELPVNSRSSLSRGVFPAKRRGENTEAGDISFRTSPLRAAHASMRTPVDLQPGDAGLRQFSFSHATPPPCITSCTLTFNSDARRPCSVPMWRFLLRLARWSYGTSLSVVLYRTLQNVPYGRASPVHFSLGRLALNS